MPDKSDTRPTDAGPPDAGPTSAGPIESGPADSGPADSGVIDNSAAHRFELIEDGHLAVADYRVDGDIVTFTHTIVPPEIGGRGVAGRLIGAALASMRRQGKKIVPQCSFVAAYVQRHPDLQDLLA